ncbi:MAG: hypothetical protein SF162_09835 [bacterium]|nr:hypothetical protein [bacterium]
MNPTIAFPTKAVRIPWARWISNLFAPPVVWGLMAFPVALRGAATQEQGLLWAFTYIALVCILPVCYIGLMVMRGQITDLHMRVREQRIRPFMVTILCTLVAWGVLALMQAAPLLLTFCAISLVQIMIMLLITLIWQISMHTMSITSAIVTGGALFGIGAAALSLPLIGLVGAARYSLRRHTLSQLVAGSILGGGLTLVLIAVTRVL